MGVREGVVTVNKQKAKPNVVIAFHMHTEIGEFSVSECSQSFLVVTFDLISNGSDYY